MRHFPLLFAAALLVPLVSAQSLYTSDRGAFLDVSRQLSGSEVTAVEAGYRLGNGLDVTLAAYGSEATRTVGAAPGLRYVVPATSASGLVVGLTVPVAHRESYRGTDDEWSAGALARIAGYTRVAVTSEVNVVPQLGLEGGALGGSGLESVLTLDGRLPVVVGRGAGGRLVLTPALRVPLLDSDQLMVRSVEPTLGLGVSF